MQRAVKISFHTTSLLVHIFKFHFVERGSLAVESQSTGRTVLCGRMSDSQSSEPGFESPFATVSLSPLTL